MIIGESGYEVKQTYCYSGNTSNHCKYSVFPAGDQPEWYNTSHGSRPRYTNQIAYFSWRSSRWSRSTHNAVITGIDGVIYNVWVTENKSLHWVAYASICISEIYANSSASANSNELVTVDISNIGGVGSYDLAILDYGIELDKVSDVEISGKVGARKTLNFIMLNRDMTLTIQLTDKRTGDIVEENIFIRLPDSCEGVVCEPECFDTGLYNTVCESGVCVQESIINVNDPECGYVPPEFPDIPDMIMGNKEILIAGVIVGAVALKSI